MKVHRFYIGKRWPKEVQRFGSQRCWVQDETLRHQWTNVLRLKVGEEIVLFDDNESVMYRIVEFKSNEVGLEKITELSPQISKGHLLAWGMIKKENNEFIMQKCTEIGISHFVPIVASRSQADNFDMERADKIVIEASEQCGRTDIPQISEPMHLAEFLANFNEAYSLMAAHVGADGGIRIDDVTNLGVMIGPEGGWSDDEISQFEVLNIPLISLGRFILRAETAAVVAAAKINGV